MSFLRKPFKYKYYNAVLLIIAANALVHFLKILSPYMTSYLGLNVLTCVFKHWWWQTITYMFVHGNFQHLFFNMLGLMFFGIEVERTIGSREFTLFYFLCGTINGIISLAGYFFTGAYYTWLIGASGALYSVLLLYAVIFPKSIIYVFGIIGIPAPLLVLLYAVIEFFSQFGGGNVAHSVHLIGFAVAWIYIVVRMGINPIRVWKNAWR